jgi:preprotein translocase SecE subunit
MNKVSWSTWKKLAQDTVVVLVTTALLTAFLLVIDLFWGWLLSDVVRVLPKHAPTKTDTQGQSAW